MSENNSGIMTLADFNISEITAETKSALDIHERISNAEQTAASAMLSLCENLKTMRDKQLYKSLGFENFADYVEKACGIKQRHAYNYISTYEKLGNSFLQSNANLGITKLQLLTEVCAVDREEFTEHNDLEGMSVAEVKKLIKQNNQRGEQLSLLQSELENSKQASDVIEQLRKENAELKNRPIEVAVQEPSQADIDKAVAEKTAEIEKQYKAEKAQAVKNAKEKALANAEKDKQKEIEEAKAAAKLEAEKHFKAQLADAESAKAEALEKAKAMASKLDKNADADLVTASVYFGEVQKALESFLQSTAKVSASEPERGAKLNAIAIQTLNQYIEKLGGKI